jgi:hypothetical protein
VALANLIVSIVGAVAAVVAAWLMIIQWRRDEIKLEIMYRKNVPGSEVRTMDVEKGLAGVLSRPSPVGYGLPEFPDKKLYLIVTVTKRSRGPLQLRGAFLEMNTSEGTKIRSFPHGIMPTLGMNASMRLYAPQDELDLTDATVVIEGDRAGHFGSPSTTPTDRELSPEAPPAAWKLSSWLAGSDGWFEGALCSTPVLAPLVEQQRV